MKKIIINSIYQDPGAVPPNLEFIEYIPELREIGKDWPSLAHTMVGLKRLNNIQACVEDVIQNDIPGDLIETGVWRGGSTIFMRAILKAYNVQDKIVWVANSFEGLPEPNANDYPQDAGDQHFKNRYLGSVDFSNW